MERDQLALSLIQMIGVPSLVPPQKECVESLANLDYAFRNRIAFLYLNALANQGRLNRLLPEYQRHLRRHNHLHSDTRVLTRSLEETGIEYVFLKTFRYYPENPNDIDLIVLGDEGQNLRAAKIIRALGYRQYEVTRGGIISFRDPRRPMDNPHSGDGANYLDLDLYREISVHNLVFFDKNRFRGTTQLRTFVNVMDNSLTTVRVLPPWLDLFFVYLHSMFPNRSYGLEIFYTTLYVLEQCSEQDIQAFVQLDRSVHLGKHMGYALSLTQQIFKESLNQSNERLNDLVSQLSGSWAKKVVGIDSYQFPYVYPLNFFLWTGIKATLAHGKGIRSAGRVLAGMSNPKYLIEIVKDIFSTQMANERYKLKY